MHPFSPQFTKLPRFSAQKLCTACGMLPREQTPQNYAICTEVWQPPNEPNFSDLSGSATGRAGPEKLLDNWWFAHLQGITVHPFSPQFTKLPRFSAQKLCTACGMLPREQTPQNYAICTEVWQPPNEPNFSDLSTSHFLRCKLRRSLQKTPLCAENRPSRIAKGLNEVLGSLW